MTSMPASRKARAMILAPRSWPSRPGLATTTRILPLGGASADTCSDLQDNRVALSATGADRGAAVATAATAQLIDERADDARAGRPDRVAQGNRATVDVDAILVDAEHAGHVERDRGKGLVDLPQVDVLGLQASLLQSLLRGRGGGAGEIGEVVGGLSMSHDLSQDFLAVGRCPSIGGDYERAAGIVDTGRVARRMGAVLDKAGQLRQQLERGVATRRLVDLDGGVALSAFDGDRDDLFRQTTLVGGLHCEFVRAQSPAIEIRSRHLELVAHLGGLD